MKQLQVTQVSEHSILVQWEALISEEIHEQLIQLQKAIELHFSEVIIETVNTYSEILIYLNKDCCVLKFKQQLQIYISKFNSTSVSLNRRVITIPVCYETDFAPDILTVASLNNLSVDKVVSIHSSTIYTVHFIGFLPGFPYLEGLSKKLHTPRKETPRTSILKGSVGIGGKQTGIYPSQSPGGWQIIGCTPLSLFNVDATPPTLLRQMDCIKFKPVSEDEFRLLEIAIKTGTYQLEIATQND